MLCKILKELTAEYDVLKSENERNKAALENLKLELTTLHHIKHYIDILELDYLLEGKDFLRNTRTER